MLNRRQWLGGSISGFFAFAMRNRLAHVFNNNSSCATAKRCIVLWMEGGPSQLDTFDPKPGQTTGGPVSSIDTSADGLQISEYLPMLAKQMHNLSVIRNLTSREGEHVRATHYMHTGFEFIPSFPRPSMGSVVSSIAPNGDLPKYISLGSPGFGPAFMGPENAPFSIQNLQEAKQLIRGIGRRPSRLQLLNQLDQSFSGKLNDNGLQQRRANLEKIQRMTGAGLDKAVDIDQLSRADRNRYGDHEFGRRCLVARRLLDLGVSFVEVQMGGWDTHQQNFRNVRRLCNRIDRPFAALVEDLKSSGMYDDTLLVWMGEFGRTPNINGQNGRDHFPRCTPVVIGGGPIKTGKAVGKTDPLGINIEGNSYRVADLFATIYSAIGISPQTEFTTDFDSPTTATDDGKIITELI